MSGLMMLEEFIQLHVSFDVTMWELYWKEKIKMIENEFDEIILPVAVSWKTPKLSELLLDVTQSEIFKRVPLLSRIW